MFQGPGENNKTMTEKNPNKKEYCLMLRILLYYNLYKSISNKTFSFYSLVMLRLMNFKYVSISHHPPPNLHCIVFK